MKALLQRVSSSSVTVDGITVGSIGRGLCVFLGIHVNDTLADVQWLARKVSSLRIFADHEGKMSKSVLDVQGELLIVSQFTLYCECRSGRRPDCTQAAPGKKAEGLYHAFIEEIKNISKITPETGRFGALMNVHIVNDGPFTLLVDSREANIKEKR